jgi:hypothetical protein
VIIGVLVVGLAKIVDATHAHPVMLLVFGVLLPLLAYQCGKDKGRDEGRAEECMRRDAWREEDARIRAA